MTRITASILFLGALASCSTGGSDPAPPPRAVPPVTDRSPTSPPPPHAGEPAAPAEPAAPTPGFRVVAAYDDVGHGLVYANGAVYAVDYTNDVVRVFDAATYAPRATLPVGHGPTYLTFAEPWVFVVNAMAAEAGDAYVTVIDSRDVSVARSLTVTQKFEGKDPDNYPWTSYPWSAAAHGNKLFVSFPTNAEPDVLAVDIGTWAEAPLWAAGSGPLALAGAADRVAVVNGRGIASAEDDALAVFTTSGSLLRTFETSGRLHEGKSVGDSVVFARSPSDHTKGELVVVDVRALTVDAVPTCGGPVGLAVLGTSVYVACQYGRAVDVVDLPSRKVTASIPLSGTTPSIVNPRGIAVSPRGDVFLESDGMISVLVK